MKRREFIKSGAFAATASFLPFQKLLASDTKSKVFEITGDPGKSVATLFSSLGGAKDFIKKDLSKAVVVLKPNLCLPHKGSNATITSTELVKAVAEYFLSEGVSRIIIADHTLQSTEQFSSVEMVNYAKSNPKINLILANEERYFISRDINGAVLKNAEILKILERADYFINMPTAKHHSATQVSLSIKNLMGIIWDRKVFHSEIDLHQGIADLAKAIRPDLNIVDASRVLLDRGPVGPGPIENPNKIFASTDMLALDSVVVSRFNFGGKSISAREIPHLWASYQVGIGEIDLDKIEVEKFSV